MRPDQIQAIAAIAQAVLALVAIIGTVVLSLFVYYGSRRVAKAQYLRSIYDAWVGIDTFFLAHPNYLEMFDKLARPHEVDKSSEVMIKRHISFLVLNPLSTLFYGMEHGYVEDDARGKLEHVLSGVLLDEDIYRQSQEELFGEAFVSLCKSVKARQLESQPKTKPVKP